MNTTNDRTLDIGCASAPLVDRMVFSAEGEEIILRCRQHGRLMSFNHVSAEDAARLKEWLDQWLKQRG